MTLGSILVAHDVLKRINSHKKNSDKTPLNGQYLIWIMALFIYSNKIDDDSAMIIRDCSIEAEIVINRYLDENREVLQGIGTDNFGKVNSLNVKNQLKREECKIFLEHLFIQRHVFCRVKDEKDVDDLTAKISDPEYCRGTSILGETAKIYSKTPTLSAKRYEEAFSELNSLARLTDKKTPAFPDSLMHNVFQIDNAASAADTAAADTYDGNVCNSDGGLKRKASEITPDVFD